MPEAPLKQRIAYALDQVGMLAVLVLLVVIFSFTVDGFFTLRNLSNMLIENSTVGIVACTMLFCLASGNFDLSVGTLIACSGVVTATVVNHLGGGKDPMMSAIPAVLLGILAGMAFGGLVGLLNGVVVAKAKINPLITTLATMQIVKTLTYVFAGGSPVTIGVEAFNEIGKFAFPDFRRDDGSLIFQVTTPVWFCIACFLFFGFLMSRTTFGRNTLAIGGNEEAARLAGINVDRAKISIFVLQGVVTAMAGILTCSRLVSAQLDVEPGLELRVISACVLGGVSLTGGVGRMTHVIAGVFIMGVVEKSMGLLQVPPFWRWGTSGGILLAAVLYDRLKQRLAQSA